MSMDKKAKLRAINNAIKGVEKQLKAEGLYEDTVLVFYGDHHGLNCTMDDNDEIVGRYLGRTYTYDEMMENLTSTSRRTDAPNEKPLTKDEYWVHPYITLYEVMEKLGVCEPLPKPEPKKRGRRPKNSIQN